MFEEKTGIKNFYYNINILQEDWCNFAKSLCQWLTKVLVVVLRRNNVSLYIESKTWSDASNVHMKPALKHSPNNQTPPNVQYLHISLDMTIVLDISTLLVNAGNITSYQLYFPTFTSTKNPVLSSCQIGKTYLK